MKPKDVLIRIMKRSGRERGIRITSPNFELSEGHIRKSDHNLVVMTDMQRLGHGDWVAIAAYYAMYHSATAVLVRIGLESKDHAATAASLDYFFGKDVGKELLKKFHAARDRNDMTQSLMIESRFVNKVKDARDFASRMKLVIAGMDDRIVEELAKKVRELKEA